MNEYIHKLGSKQSDRRIRSIEFCLFFPPVIVVRKRWESPQIACLRSRDSGEARRADGGQGAYGRDGGKSASR